MTNWVYEVHIDGQVSDAVLAQLQAELGQVVTTTEPATTVIRGQIPDQSALIGVLSLLHRLGLNVSEARRVVDLNEQSDADLRHGSSSPRSEARPK